MLLDFVQLAQSMGCLGTRVERPADLEQALRGAVVSERPHLVDVIVG